MAGTSTKLTVRANEQQYSHLEQGLLRAGINYETISRNSNGTITFRVNTKHAEITRAVILSTNGVTLL